MIRFSLFLAFFSVVLTLSAQKAESVFIDKEVLAWYDDEVKTLEKTIKLLSAEDVDYKAKKQLKKSIELINKNCLSIFHKMENFLDEETLSSLRDQVQDGGHGTALDYRNAMMRSKNSHKFTELLMTQADADQFLDNLSLIKNIDDELKQSDYSFALNTKSSTADSQLAKLSELAQKNNQLLKSKYN